MFNVEIVRDEDSIVIVLESKNLKWSINYVDGDIELYSKLLYMLNNNDNYI